LENDKQYINRLNRVEGQIRGITKMLEDDRECKEIVTQLSAVKAGIDKIITMIVSDNLLTCVAGDSEDTKREKLEEALRLIFKSR
jgi:DNA-binding FrmR family transcriptional regulator